MAQIDLKKATITIRDGTPDTSTTAQNYIEIRIGEGTISWTERVEREYTTDRGILDEIRNGNETPMDVSFDVIYEYVRGAPGSGEPPTPSDALKQIGNAASWVSTDADTCRPYAVDIQIDYDPECGTGNTETVILPDFRYEELVYDLSEGTIACSGRCNATAPVVTRP